MASNTPFFDEFNKAKRHGSDDTIAYIHAIKTIDGMCYHPEFAINAEAKGGLEYKDEDGIIRRTTAPTCQCCGMPVLHNQEWMWSAKPVKIATYKDQEQLLATILNYVTKNNQG